MQVNFNTPILGFKNEVLKEPEWEAAIDTTSAVHPVSAGETITLESYLVEIL